MKTKRKEKEKKEEKKGKEARFCPDSNSGHLGECFITRPRGERRVGEILLLKPSSLIKHEFKDIFQKNDFSLDSENPT